MALAISVVALGGLLGAGCGGDSGGDESSGGSTDTSTGTNTGGSSDTDSAAIALFDSACAGCHVFTPADASGPVGPNLDETTLSESEIEAQIADGGGTMPAYADELSAAEISSLAGLISNSN